MSVPFLLTEIALELLGNKFYNVNGEHCANLKDLFNPSTSKNANNDVNCEILDENHLISQLGLSELSLFGSSSSETSQKNNTNADGNKNNCIEYLDKQLMQVIGTAKVHSEANSASSASKSLKCTSSKTSISPDSFKNAIEQERMKILLASQNEKQMLFTSSTTAIEKVQFSHVEKMRLLCEASEIIKTIDLLLSRADMDDETKKKKIEGILAMTKFTHEM